jgi:hypothetical protein
VSGVNLKVLPVLLLGGGDGGKTKTMILRKQEMIRRKTHLGAQFPRHIDRTGAQRGAQSPTQ